MTHEAFRKPLNPIALSVADAARLLSKVGAPSITAEMLQVDVDDGAPTNADGTINLVHYGAWLLQQRGSNAGESNGD